MTCFARILRTAATVIAVPAILIPRATTLAMPRSSATVVWAMPAGLVLQGHLLFTRAGGHYGDETVYAANADGSHQHRLTPFGGSCCARITNDGRRILFAASSSDGRITTATVYPVGAGYRTIPLPDKTINLGPGAWSPDGRYIAFQVWNNSKPARNGMYIGRASDGGDLRRVTSAKAGNDLPGDFSPNGKRIAFFRERPDKQSVGSVWVVNVDGTGLKRLTPPKFLAGFGTVRWSPDATKILFADAGDQPRGDLWTIHPDGSHLTRVFQDSKGRFAISPTWSPNGKQIMFALDPTNHEDDHSPNGLYVINANGSGLRRAIGGNNFKSEPDWVR